MDSFVKIIRPGTVKAGRRNVSLFVKIEWDGRRLSITGVEGPTPTGNAAGSCGQVVDSLGRIKNYAPGWSYGKVRQLRRLWRRWHLNDAQAGTPKQEAAIKVEQAARATWGFPPLRDYREICAYLESIGLLVDDGYRYGTAWLHEDVPVDVLSWLAGLPDTDRQPAWI